MAKKKCIHPRVEKRLQFSVCLWWIAASFSFTGAILLIVFGSTFVKYRVHIQDFKMANCSGNGYIFVGSEDCNCGKGCSSSYPCYKVFVNYTDYEGTQHARRTLFLGPDELGDKCALKPCSSDRSANDREVKEFAQKYGNSSAPFECHYSPDESNEVVVDFDTNILHFLLWPSLVCGLFLLASIVLCWPCSRAYQESKRLYEQDSQGGGRPPGAGSHCPPDGSHTNKSYSADLPPAYTEATTAPPDDSKRDSNYDTRYWNPAT